MGIFKKLFGGGDTIEKGFALIDSIHTSKEEEIKTKGEAKIGILKAYEAFKVAQRYLALLFSFTYVFTFFTALVMLVFTEPSVENLIALIKAFRIGEIVFLIVGFYFGGGLIEGGISAYKKKKEA